MLRSDSLHSTYVAFARDLRLTFLVTSAYGDPELGVSFGNVYGQLWQDYDIGLRFCELRLDFTARPDVVTDLGSYQDEALRDAGITEVALTAEKGKGGALWLIMGPGRFVNVSKRVHIPHHR